MSEFENLVNMKSSSLDDTETMKVTMNTSCIAAALIALLAGPAYAEDQLPPGFTKSVQTRHFNAVTQEVRNGEVVTQNRVVEYEVGTKLVYEDGICWTVVVTEIGSKTLPVRILVKGEKVVVKQQMPVLKSEKTPIECPTILGMTTLGL